MEQKLHTPINHCVSMMSRRDRKWVSMGKSQCEMDMRIMHLIIQVIPLNRVTWIITDRRQSNSTAVLQQKGYGFCPTP